MTEILPALIAGLLGVPFGMAARALARRYCGRPAVPGPLLIEGVMAVLWALLALRLWPAHPAALPAYLALAFVCLTLAVIDLRTKLLPNRITYPALPLVAALLLLASAAEHHLGPMVRALEACGLAGVAFLALVLISPSGLGLGDVLTELLGGSGPDRVTARLDQADPDPGGAVVHGPGRFQGKRARSTASAIRRRAGLREYMAVSAAAAISAR